MSQDKLRQITEKMRSLTEEELKRVLEEKEWIYMTHINHTLEGEVERVYTIQTPVGLTFVSYPYKEVKQTVEIPPTDDENGIRSYECPKCGIKASFIQEDGYWINLYSCEHFSHVNKKNNHAIFKFVEYVPDENMK